MDAPQDAECGDPASPHRVSNSRQRPLVKFMANRLQDKWVNGNHKWQMPTPGVVNASGPDFCFAVNLSAVDLA